MAECNEDFPANEAGSLPDCETVSTVHYNHRVVSLPITFCGIIRIVKSLWDTLTTIEEQTCTEIGFNGGNRLVTAENYSKFMRVVLTICDAKLVYAQRKYEHIAWKHFELLSYYTGYQEHQLKQAKFLSARMFHPLAVYVKSIGCFNLKETIYENGEGKSGGLKDLIVVPMMMKTLYENYDGAINYSRDAIRTTVSICASWIVVDSDMHRLAERLNHLPNIIWRSRTTKFEDGSYELHEVRLSRQSVDFWSADETFPFTMDDDGSLYLNLIKTFGSSISISSLDIANGEGSNVQLVRFSDDIYTVSGDQILFYSPYEFSECDIQLASAFMLGAEHENSIDLRLNEQDAYAEAPCRGTICGWKNSHLFIVVPNQPPATVLFDTIHMRKMKLLEAERQAKAAVSKPTSDKSLSNSLRSDKLPTEDPASIPPVVSLPCSYPANSRSSYQQKSSNRNRHRRRNVCIYMEYGDVVVKRESDDEDSNVEMLLIEPGLRADHVCQLLLIKNGFQQNDVADGSDYYLSCSLYEQWPDLQLERCIEDHELLLDVINADDYDDDDDERSLKPKSETNSEDDGVEAIIRRTSKKFIFRRNEEKYRMFDQTLVVFPYNMCDVSRFCICDASWPQFIQDVILDRLSSPPMFGQVWISSSSVDCTWSKIYLLLIGQRLYVSSKMEFIDEYVQRWMNLYYSIATAAEEGIESGDDDGENDKDDKSDSNDENDDSDDDDDDDQTEVLNCFYYPEDIFGPRNIDDGEWYLLVDMAEDEQQLICYNCDGISDDEHSSSSCTSSYWSLLRSAPTEFAICIRAAVTDDEISNSSRRNRMHWIVCESQSNRRCWLDAIRLANYGEQLHTNYENAKIRRRRLADDDDVDDENDVECSNATADDGVKDVECLNATADDDVKDVECLNATVEDDVNGVDCWNATADDYVANDQQNSSTTNAQDQQDSSTITEDIQNSSTTITQDQQNSSTTIAQYIQNSSTTVTQDQQNSSTTITQDQQNSSTMIDCTNTNALTLLSNLDS